MTNQILSNYKLVYLDTNIVSDLCKPNDLLLKFISRFPPDQNYLLCFSTYTLFEVQRNTELFERFKKMYSVYPCAIVMSYFPLGVQEVDLIDGKLKRVNPIIFSPQGIKIDGKALHPECLDIMLSLPMIKESFENIKSYTDLFYQESITLLSKSEFQHIDKNRASQSKSDFIRTYRLYELKQRFFNGQTVKVDKKKLKHLKSLDVLAQGIFFKFYSDATRKSELGDIIDILIMTTVPYVHTFISERNSIDVMQKIFNYNSDLRGPYLMTLSELRM